MVNTVDFYHLNYCHSSGRHKYVEGIEDINPKDTLDGVTMFDTELHESFFTYKVNVNQTQIEACNRTLTDTQIKDFKDAILYRYKFRLYVDGLPAAVREHDPLTGVLHKTDYDHGVPVGKLINDNGVEDLKYILYNHWDITVKTSFVSESNKVRIVGFEVVPHSIAQGSKPSDKAHKPLYLSDLKDEPLKFTYTITNINDPTTVWATRMDHYLKFGNENIHAAAIFLSLAIIAALVIILVGMMKRGLNKDFVNIAKNKLNLARRR